MFPCNYHMCLLWNKIKKLIRPKITKVGYFYWHTPLFSRCFLAETFIQGVYSAMTCHNMSCQHKITVCILVHGCSGDALSPTCSVVCPQVEPMKN